MSKHKIIHQIFLDIGLKPYKYRKDYQRNVSINKAMNPDYKHILWRDKEVEKFIETQSKKIQYLWNDFPDPFYKIDFVRYLILKEYGGIYIDLDVYCKMPLSKINDKNRVPKILGKWVDPKTGKVRINNNVISLDTKLYPKLIKYAISQYNEKKQMPIYKTWKKRRFLHSVGSKMFVRFAKINKIEDNKIEFVQMFEDEQGESWVTKQF